MRCDRGLRVVTPRDLPLDPMLFSAMAFMYNVMELATALKPILLSSLLAKYEADSATYLDPDTFVYAPIPTIADRSGEAVALLTPHRLTPPPFDGLKPDEALFLRHGAFNLGYVSVHARGGTLLSWWSERLIVDAVISNRDSLFTDQKWMDLAPTYFNIEQLRDPGVNVAWWNLDGRILSQLNGKTMVNGSPLRMAHFSGYRPGKSAPIIRDLSSLGEKVSSARFGELADEYLNSLGLELANGGDRKPYEFSNFSNGRSISKYDRRTYRISVRAEIIAGKLVHTAPWDRPPTYLGRSKRTLFAVVDATLGVAIPWEITGKMVKHRIEKGLRRGHPSL
jgi:hypothetical protein